MAHSLREKLHTVIEITRSSVMLFSGWARPHNASCPSARLSVCLFVSNVLSTLNHEISKKNKIVVNVFSGRSNRYTNFQFRKATVESPDVKHFTDSQSGAGRLRHRLQTRPNRF